MTGLEEGFVRLTTALEPGLAQATALRRCSWNPSTGFAENQARYGQLLDRG